MTRLWFCGVAGSEDFVVCILLVFIYSFLFVTKELHWILVLAIFWIHWTIPLCSPWRSDDDNNPHFIKSNSLVQQLIIARSGIYCWYGPCVLRDGAGAQFADEYISRSFRLPDLTLLVVELCVPAAHRETGTHNTVLWMGQGLSLPYQHKRLQVNKTGDRSQLGPKSTGQDVTKHWLSICISKLEPPTRDIGRIKRFCKSSSWMIQEVHPNEA